MLKDNSPENVTKHRNYIMRYKEVPACENCGCLGSMECGHNPIGEDCGMDGDILICKCCQITISSLNIEG